MVDVRSRILRYQSEYMNDYGFERVMVWARQKYIARLIKTHNPETVIEIGCGFDQLFEVISDLPSIREWVIIEPSDAFVSSARDKLKEDGRVRVIKDFIENVIEQSVLPKADLCICSGLLHEVAKPESILLSTKEILHENGLLHVNVPNAKSFHRLLGCEMGLINSPYQLSDRNIALSQYHVFDSGSLRELVESVGLEVKDSGGYFIKPFTHAQMEKVIRSLGGDILEGLWDMGVAFPELASEIYVNACWEKR